MTGTYRLKRIGIGSAFKIGAVLGFVLSAIILVPLGLLMALGVVNTDNSSAVALSAYFAFLTMFCGPLAYAVIYGIVAALNALVFNIIAGFVGGLEVDLERVSSAQPIDVDEIMRNLRQYMGTEHTGASSPPPTPTVSGSPDTTTTDQPTGTYPKGGEPEGGVPSVDDVW